eukprot:TRINITY_DN5146_c0_g1_i2.p2 TRINITY_DN5146_c0_g1~~TRINITY_DN5146_c0_g1_i2.p2  ORF type:complete len:108 (-),score=1.31 TRINITY_DN5146_c0_g1_i2:124-447(-)
MLVVNLGTCLNVAIIKAIVILLQQYNQFLKEKQIQPFFFDIQFVQIMVRFQHVFVQLFQYSRLPFCCTFIKFFCRGFMCIFVHINVLLLSVVKSCVGDLENLQEQKP